MDYEDDEYCTADYGAFGDNACNCSSCKPLGDLEPYMKVTKPDRVSIQIIKDRKTSADFNSHMIHLFNKNNPL